MLTQEQVLQLLDGSTIEIDAGNTPVHVSFGVHMRDDIRLIVGGAFADNEKLRSDKLCLEACLKNMTNLVLQLKTIPDGSSVAVKT